MDKIKFNKDIEKILIKHYNKLKFSDEEIIEILNNISNLCIENLKS